MVKKKHEYRTEHVLTLEKARELFWMSITGLISFGVSLALAYFLVGSNCCGLDEPCSFAAGIGTFVCWILVIAMFMIGLMLMTAFFWDESDMKEVKIKCIVSEEEQ